MWYSVASTLWSRLRDAMSACFLKFCLTIPSLITASLVLFFSPFQANLQFYQQAPPAPVLELFSPLNVSHQVWIDRVLSSSFHGQQTQIFSTDTSLIAISIILIVAGRIEEITTCAPDPSQSPEVSFYSSQTSLLFHHCQLEKPTADYNQRALLASRVFQWCSLSQPLGDIRIPCKLGPVCIWGPLLPSGGSLLLQPPFPSCWQIRTWLGYRWFQEVPLSQQDLHPPHQLSGLLVPEPHTHCRRYQEAPTTWVFILVPKWSGLVSPNFYTLSWAVTGWCVILSWNISPTYIHFSMQSLI